jgi:D-serine deaminase-like pyridoxal phosphate-dependent protein
MSLWVGEAEVLVGGGVKDVLVSNQVVGDQAPPRGCR